MKKQYECKLCGNKGVAKKNTPGSILIELILWLFFIIPGLFYSCWRVSKRELVCTNCGKSSHLVPIQ